MNLRGAKSTFVFCLFFALAVPFSASAQIYKWIDQNGKVQYGDSPPTDKKDSQQLSVNSNRQVDGNMSSSWEEKDREFRKRRIERQMRAEKETPSVSAEQMCRNAKYKLQMLDGKVVYRVNDEGERVYMEDAERNAIEKQAKQDISVYCRR